MSDVPFYQTRMGRQFYEATVPRLVNELVRLNELIERLPKALERLDAPRGEDPPCRT